MDNTRRHARICIHLAQREVTEAHGPVADLDATERRWRREDLASAFRDYREIRVQGVGATWREALQDAASRGRFDLTPYDGSLDDARDALARGAIWDFTATPNGTALVGPLAF
ncbi:hypothetical protein [Streptomyces sp. NPDC052535]|uniref:hypothetical protein n=1 Tax=Streptomyces sp. NPDC052535 TaxID=3155531 RepID=UPI0034415966